MVNRIALALVVALATAAGCSGSPDPRLTPNPNDGGPDTATSEGTSTPEQAATTPTPGIRQLIITPGS